MNPYQLRAQRVAEIATAYAYRRAHHIAHTGHTVQRLLDAVSALLGERVVIDEGVALASAREELSRLQERQRGATRRKGPT